MDGASGNGRVERGELWSTMCHQTVWCPRFLCRRQLYCHTRVIGAIGQNWTIASTSNILGKLGILRSGICAGSHFEKTSSSACIQAVLLLSWTMRVSFRCINLSVNVSSPIYRVNPCHTLLLQGWVWTKARDSGLGFGKDSITARQEPSSSAPTTQPACNWRMMRVWFKDKRVGRRCAECAWNCPPKTDEFSLYNFCFRYVAIGHTLPLTFEWFWCSNVSTDSGDQKWGGLYDFGVSPSTT